MSPDDGQDCFDGNPDLFVLQFGQGGGHPEEGVDEAEEGDDVGKQRRQDDLRRQKRGQPLALRPEHHIQ